jgi:beta-galactosidase
MIVTKSTAHEIKLVFTILLFLFVQCQNQSDLISKKSISSSLIMKVKQPPQTFFPESDLMKIGVYYYPEQWPKDQWKRDFENIARLGFEFTHLAEFSWTFLEPEEGKFDFSWLDEAIDLASGSGLKVIMCTPTLCPPAWMGEKYPEIYLVGSDGLRREHGIRANASLSNLHYQKYVDRIVTVIAEHYRNDARIWGWQIDNEPLATSDYSRSAQVAFQQWLKERYGNIDKMNSVWGGSFWSTRYNNFEQVLIPNAAMNEEDKLSPHALLDFQRFTADVTANFLNRQADILRNYINPDQWITTNYINQSISADPRRSDHLDFPTFTMYPVNGRNEMGGNNFRTGNPYRMYEACDYFRSINGITGLMELQIGQVNWGQINPQVLPGATHMWIMQAFGGGCSFLCTYRYRHPLYSSEMYYDGIVGPDGLTLSRGGSEFVRAIKDMKALRAEYDSTAIMPVELMGRKTAFLWSHEVMWDIDIQKQTTLWDSWRNRNVYSSAVKSTGAPMDFISENDDFSGYPFIVAPSYQLVDTVIVNKWIDYVGKGGNLILSCRTGQKDKNSHFFEAEMSTSIISLIGAKQEFFDMMVPDIKGTVRTENLDYKWNTWAEILTPDKDTDVLSTYSDQFYKGKAAVVTRHLGKGTVTYIGVVSEDGLLERKIVRDVYARAGVKIEDFPKGVFMEWRDGFRVAVNYTDQDYKMTITPKDRILIGNNPLKSGQAIVWKTQK